MTTMNKKYISRHDRLQRNGNPMRGWNVRVRKNGVPHPKFFSDREYGSKYAAFVAAVVWRDDKMKALGMLITDARVIPNNRKAKPVMIRLTSGDIRWEIVCSLGPANGRSRPVKRRFETKGEAIDFRKACEANRMRLRRH